MTAVDDIQAIGVDPAVLRSEQDILGAALQSAETVGPDDYSRPAHVHAHVRRAMLALVGRGDSVDITAVAGELGGIAALPEGRDGGSRTLLDVIGPSYLHRLTESFTMAGSAGYHARTVADAGRRRRWVDALTWAARHAEKPAADLDEVIADTRAPGSPGGFHPRATRRHIASLLVRCTSIRFRQGQPGISPAPVKDRGQREPL
ncbi:DnaB-like helicase N-terminal domain-containing protein [Frankia sp. CiP3]|uniref:DnaB-like helicase N-terminal domain-containing protein n=1 Tax=Frankia sp. CiP3 TaxID=2880971 RepID=UPI001EF6D6BA|nr:DnaB-like helicase N-terminal domain-containing protein [Frankia sp. CiP3]